jgi:hypothetical protein
MLLDKTWEVSTRLYIRMRQLAGHDEQESLMDATQDQCVKNKSTVSEQRYASKQVA